MFKQELPLMFPDDEKVKAVAAAFHDPFEFLHKLHKAGRLKTDFKQKLGNVSYHVACHQRVQNIGPKTKQILELIEGTSVNNIERCSGHDGTYGVKSETLKFANKIAKPIVRQITQQNPTTMAATARWPANTSKTTCRQTRKRCTPLTYSGSHTACNSHSTRDHFMNSEVKIAMKKIALADLLSLEAYEAQRPVIRQAIMDHKRPEGCRWALTRHCTLKIIW